MIKDMVSVVIPTYNRAGTMARAIKGILEQTYENIELLIVDDGSTDKTEEIVNGFKDKRIRYIKLEKNGGACAARNIGISKAQGQYIMLQDSDDLSYKDRIEKQVNSIIENASDVCIGKCRRIGYGKRYEAIFPTFEKTILEAEMIRRRTVISGGTVLAYKYVFDECLFDESLEMWQDYDWAIRTSEKFKFCMVNDLIADVFMQGDSITSKSRETMLRTNEYLYKKYENRFCDFPELEVSLLNNIIMNKVILGKECKEDSKLLIKKATDSKGRIKGLMGLLGLLGIYISARDFLGRHGFYFNKL